MTTPARRERCETCRFWADPGGACHRYPPVVRQLGNVLAGVGARAATVPQEPELVWPATPAWSWCGEWVATLESDVSDPPLVRGDHVAAHLLLGRLAPSLEIRDPGGLMQALLNQLPPDVRRVIVRMHGLDGQPLEGLRDVARQFRISQGQLRALLAAGEQRLTEAINRLGNAPSLAATP